MTRSKAAVVAVFAMFVLPSDTRGDPFDADFDSTCVTCHEVEPDEELSISVPQWRDSVHAAASISCDACHGGDPRIEDADESMSEEAGFLDLPSWREISDECGVCHEEIAATWNVGRFGQMVADRRVATCADCHMRDGHRIKTAVPEDMGTADTCPSCPTVADPTATLSTLRDIAKAEDHLAGAIAIVEGKGIDMTDLRLGVSQVHAAFARTVHEFDDGSILAAKALASTQYVGLGEQVAALEVEADGRRRFGVGLLAALALLFVALFSTSRSLRS